jgi:5'(3')-deoxyribonucleotidase
MNTCYLDLDGVLADFTTSALAVHNQHIPYNELDWNFFKKLNLTEEEFWKPLGYDFWFNLQPTNEAFNIVRVVRNWFKRSNIVILTSPCDTKGCIEGKLDWVQKWFPEYRRQCFVGGNKYLVGHKNALLIDDSDNNIDKYKEVGPTYLIPRPWNIDRAYESNLVLDLNMWLDYKFNLLS